MMMIKNLEKKIEDVDNEILNATGIVADYWYKLTMLQKL